MNNMDEQVIRLFTEVGPQAGDALDSYIALQWAGFWAKSIFVFVLVIAIGFGIYKVITSAIPDQKGDI